MSDGGRGIVVLSVRSKEDMSVSMIAKASIISNAKEVRLGWSLKILRIICPADLLDYRGKERKKASKDVGGAKS